MARSFKQNKALGDYIERKFENEKGELLFNVKDEAESEFEA